MLNREQIVTVLTLFFCRSARLRSIPSRRFLRIRQSLLGFALLVLPVSAHLSEASPDARLNHCFAELDGAVKTYDQGRADLAKERLKILEQSCSKVPHLYHNLGALALLKQEWDEAIAFFEKSLALDPRANRTQQTLASIYRYRAALAYRKALNLQSPEPALPRVELQTSALRNSYHPPTNSAKLLLFDTDGHTSDDPESHLPLKQAHFDVSTWWQAQIRHDLDTYFAYYAPGIFPNGYATEETWRSQLSDPNSRLGHSLPNWSNVTFFAETLDDYILVNLRYTTTGKGPEVDHGEPAVTNTIAETDQSKDMDTDKHTLLVLRRHQQIWQIIKEQTW